MQHSVHLQSVRIIVTNDDWRGKNDPIERRRIQNRLNQRAARERWRAKQRTKPSRLPQDADVCNKRILASTDVSLYSSIHQVKDLNHVWWRR
jgi:hypothetical protein